MSDTTPMPTNGRPPTSPPNFQFGIHLVCGSGNWLQLPDIAGVVIDMQYLLRFDGFRATEKTIEWIMKAGYTRTSSSSCGNIALRVFESLNVPEVTHTFR